MQSSTGIIACGLVVLVLTATGRAWDDREGHGVLALYAPAWMHPFDVNQDDQIAFSEWPADRRGEFLTYDKDGDGYLSPKEVKPTAQDILSRYVKKEEVLPSRLPREMARMDIDRDGQLGMYEWNPNDYDRFLKLDANHDGFLVPSELGGGPQQVTTRHQAQQVETAKTLFTDRAAKTFRLADRDGDGELSQDEWNNARLSQHVKESPSFPVTPQQFVAVYLAANRPD